MWEKFIEGLTNVNAAINGVVWGWPVIILILGTGLLLSIRTGFLQLRKFGDSMGSTIVPAVKSMGKKSDTKGVSQFEAFATAISGTVGTGNIVGVAAAILSGGPGAVLWMWISAFFGMVTNYSENVLGLYYRKKDGQGGFSGGAFYYLENGLKFKKHPKINIIGKILAYMAAIVCLFAAVGMSGVQTNKISATLGGTLGDAFAVESGSQAETLVKLLIGIIVALVAAVIIIGGIKRIGRVASKLIPFMSLLFIVLALIAIFMHASNIGPAFKLIFEDAFNLNAAAGGLMGYLFSVTIQKGMARGVFSNEAGLGSSVIAHSASETREPVKQGLWGVFEVFFDTFVICTLSALMFITTNYDFILKTTMEEAAGIDDSMMAMSMFSDNFGVFGTACFCIILPLFAFTTILAWSYYGEKACEFCFKWVKSDKARKNCVLIFKILYVLFIVAAAVISSSLVWDIDDTFNGLMSIPNLIGLIVMSGTVAKITKNYYDRKKGRDVEPMLSAYPDLNEEFKQDILAGEKEMQ
ncbi:MAG: alanine:cation symporter family protein [Clostridia bacterium]|nr:alanine:cation symporter family protein [Clostridia bacterium]